MQDTSQNRIRVALRLDDPSGTSNHALESEVIRRLRRHRIPATFAVIPLQPGDPDTALCARDVPHLIDAVGDGIVEVAQHGRCHRNRGSSGIPTELAGLSVQDQTVCLRPGFSALMEVFGRRPQLFVPPFNSYDMATVAAAAELGMTAVSAGSPWRNVPNDRLGIVPHTCQLTGLQEALVEAEHFITLDPVVVALFHHYDFKEHDPQTGKLTLDDFDALLTQLAHSANVEMVTIGTLAKTAPRQFDHDAQRGWEQVANAKARLPYFLRHALPANCLPGIPLSRGHCLARVGLALPGSLLRRALRSSVIVSAKPE